MIYWNRTIAWNLAVGERLSKCHFSFSLLFSCLMPSLVLSLIHSVIYAMVMYIIGICTRCDDADHFFNLQSDRLCNRI